MWAIKAIVLCGLSLAVVVVIAILSGVTMKAFWGLLTKGSLKEFVSPEGRLCLLIGALFVLFLLLTMLTPNLIAFLARVIEPDSFSEPKDSAPVTIWLVFLYCLVNILMVGLLYYHDKSDP